MPSVHHDKTGACATSGTPSSCPQPLRVHPWHEPAPIERAEMRDTQPPLTRYRLHLVVGQCRGEVSRQSTAEMRRIDSTRQPVPSRQVHPIHRAGRCAYSSRSWRPPFAWRALLHPALAYPPRQSLPHRPTPHSLHPVVPSSPSLSRARHPGVRRVLNFSPSVPQRRSPMPRHHAHWMQSVGCAAKRTLSAATHTQWMALQALPGVRAGCRAALVDQQYSQCRFRCQERLGAGAASGWASGRVERGQVAPSLDRPPVERRDSSCAASRDGSGVRAASLAPLSRRAGRTPPDSRSKRSAGALPALRVEQGLVAMGPKRL